MPEMDQRLCSSSHSARTVTTVLVQSSFFTVGFRDGRFT